MALNLYFDLFQNIVMSIATDAAEASLQSVVLVNDDQLQEHSAVGENEGMIIYTTTSDITQNDESGDVSHEELQIGRYTS